MDREGSLHKKVSVIVPVYKAMQWLERCVQSIAGQTWENLEIILVDDGSPDDCPRLCDEWAQRDERIRVIHKTNGGPMSACITGAQQSSGDYLCFVDSDDWVDTCMVEKMLEASSDCGREVICGNYIQEESRRSFAVIQPLEPGSYAGAALQDKVFCRLLGEERRPITLSRCMKLYSRRLIIENLHYCDPFIRMGDDVNFILPALLDAERIVILKDAAYYHYLFLRDSLVHSYDPGLFESVTKLTRAAAGIMQEKGVSNWKEQTQRELLLLFFLEIKNEVRSNRAGWRQRLRTACMSGEVQTALRETTLTLEDWRNRLLYRVIRKPDFVMLSVIRGLFWLQDCRKR